MYMNNEPKNEKWNEWCKKNENEQAKIAEENEWGWYFEWGTTGDILRAQYEKADPDPKPANKYGGYDQYYAEHEIGKSYVYLGMDASFHHSDKPTNVWTEFTPCTNTECSWHKDDEKYGNCRFYGERPRLFECFEQLFATIQSFIDVCGIENIDELQKDLNIHPDIIGWFKEGDEYFKKKEGDKMYLNEDAVEEITNLLHEVQEVVEFVGNIGITYQSDSWNATVPSDYDYENILAWTKEHVQHIDITNIDHFVFGGSVCIAEYDYKGKYISGPKELHQAKVDTVKKYMQEVVDNFEAKYFEISNVGAEDIYDNCGWECSVDFAVTPIKPKCCIQDNTDKLIEQIADEDLKTAEDPWIEYNTKNPDDNQKYYAMVGFHSCKLINPEERIYRADFGPNRKYIQDASKLIREIENEAEELRIKYADKGIKVSIGDFNDGCEYGMSIYVWVPYQKQPAKEMPKHLHYH